MNVLALNLPAFHRIPENDEWWGNGFTEWDNVRRGKPLYSGHIQPMVPYGEYYYDLSKKEDVISQAKLAKQYGIGGFIYYHYWFSGKKLLEKPVEIYRDSASEIDLPYCFCWANEAWARTWDGKDKEILMPQAYGEEPAWSEHLQYLLSFFKDTRYIKRNNKPMLFIYNASAIYQIDRMIAFWNEEIKKQGFDGLYIVEFINNFNPNAFSELSDAVMEFEPMYTNRYDIGLLKKCYRFYHKKTKKLEIANYDETWGKILKRSRTYGGREIIQGCFTAWDNTPRKGKSGLIFKGSSPEKFESYFSQLLKKERVDVSKEYVVINAWNEWGEGAMLEPSEQYGFKYLESVQRAIKRFNEGKAM